jgi:predicted metal-dependent peptidase
MSGQPIGRYPASIIDRDIDPTWQAAMSDARVAVTMASPLFAYAMVQCDMHWTHELATAGATMQNGKGVLYFNPTFFMEKLNNTKQRAFVILHEVEHVFLQHIGRQVEMNYHAELWNYAADYYINLSCNGTYTNERGSIEYDTHRYQRFMERPSIGLYKECYLGMSADEIYFKLLEENDNDPDKAVQSCGEGSGEGQTKLDDIGAEPLSGTDKMAANRIMSGAVASASGTKSIGDSEGDIVKAIRDLFTPKISWVDKLDLIVSSASKEMTTYNRLSRRTQPGDRIFFPSNIGNSMNIVFGVDTSGSMSDNDLKEAASEILGVVDEFDDWSVDLVTCDTGYHVIGHYSSEEEDSFDDISLDWIGGGGTDMKAIVEYAAQRVSDGDEINACIIVTDGFIPPIPTDSFGDDTKYIFVVTSNGNHELEVAGAEVIFMNQH